MNIFSVFSLLGGLAFFLYGMTVMSTGLEKMAGGRLEKTLKKMTSNPFKSLALGAGITIAIQSSSAMTVMLVGLVNSGIMQLEQTVGVIFGSNIGTTLTAWILSLAGIEGDNIWIKMLKPESFSPVVALIGIVLIMISKNDRKKDLGSIFIGFSVLMFGMTLMGDAVEPLAESPAFSKILVAFQNPLLGVLVGAVFTGVIQSSAASIGILQALSATGSITYSMAIPIVMGQNIGTCVTSLLSSIGVNKNAKRVAAVHVFFNLIGTVVCLALYYPLDLIFQFTFTEEVASPVGIAFCHSVFNIVTTVLLLPFSKYLVKLATLTVRDKNEKDKYSFLDERLLNTPSFALSECDNLTVEMAHVAKQTFLNSVRLVYNAEENGTLNEKLAGQITSDEKQLDRYEDKLGSFLVKLSSRELSDSDSREISKLLHTIGDFERIGDHGVNLLGVAREIADKGISFSPQAKEELKVLGAALSEIITITITAFEENNLNLAKDVEPLEQVVDQLTTQIKSNHIERLQTGDCTIEMGFVLSDLLNNFERVSDHCSNIAVAMIEVAQNSFATHKYLKAVKDSDNADFSDRFREYEIKYRLS